MELEIEDTGITLLVEKDGTISTKDRKIQQKSSAGNLYTKTIKGKVLAQTSNGTGYLQVKLNYSGKSKRLYVHRVVWEAFKGKIPEGYEIDHIDDVKENCALANLQLFTRKQNMDKCHNNNPHLVHNLKNNHGPEA